MINDDGLNTITRVTVQLNDGLELFRRYLSESPYGGLVIDVDSSLAEEDLVELDVSFKKSQQRHLIKAVVLWRRHHKQGLTVGIGFLPSEIEKREKLLAASRHAPTDASAYDTVRTANRYQAVLKVTYKTTEDFVLHFTRNLSYGGMFVSATKPPDVGSDILFKLFAPGQLAPIDLPGRVVWSEPGNGFGVSFSSDSQQAQERLEELVRHLSIRSGSEISKPVVEQLSN